MFSSINNKNGFTMLELMVTVALIALISAIAIPSLGQIAQRREISRQAGDINDAFQLARSSALTNGGGISVCWNTGGAPSNLAMSNTLVVADTSDGANTLIKIIDLQPAGYRVSTTNVAGNCISFDTLGRSLNAVNFGVCRVGGNAADLLTISVNSTGRSVISKNNPDNFSCA